MMNQLSVKEFNTLSLIKAIEGVAKTHELNGVEVDVNCPEDVYGMLYVEDKEDTIELFREIMGLASLGYANICLDETDLEEKYVESCGFEEIGISLTEKGENALIEFYNNEIEGISDEPTVEKIADRIINYWKTVDKAVLFNNVLQGVNAVLAIAVLIKG